MSMTHCHRKCICGVLAGNFGQFQQSLDHVLHLCLFRKTGSDNRLFDLARGVFKYFHLMIGTGNHSNTTRMPELQG